MNATRRNAGITLIELLVSVVVMGLLFAGLNSVVTGLLGSSEYVSERAALTREAEFAMDRMVRMVARSSLLVLPQADKAATAWPENLREETVPPSAPVGGSAKATAVLSVLLPVDNDLDFNGVPDADNDGDGAIDEDLFTDMNWDGFAGVRGIDDGGDGFADDVNWWDDDETFGVGGEDPINGLDDDGDGLIDEDSSGDMNGDGSPGLAGVDDDGDGFIDEGDAQDDDEDGMVDEDWFDTVTYFLQGDLLIERMPVPWDVTGNGSVTGWDYVESPIAERVTRLRFERVPTTAGQSQLVDITLQLTTPAAGTVSLNTRVRVGGAL